MPQIAQGDETHTKGLNYMNLTDLISGLSSGGPAKRKAAAEHLGRLGAVARPAVRPLVYRLDDESRDVADACAETILRIGSAAIPDLVLLIRDPIVEEKLRFAAADILADLGRTALPAMIELVDDIDPCARMAAIDALPRLGSPAECTIKKLTEIFNSSSHYNITYSAAMAIVKIAAANRSSEPSTRALGEVLEGLAKGTVFRRRAAASALRFSGPRGSEVIPELKKARLDPDDEVRHFVEWAIEVITQGNGERK